MEKSNGHVISCIGKLTLNPFHQVLTELESYHELRVMIDTLGSFDRIKMSTRGGGWV
jgi:hypothetical protein